MEAITIQDVRRGVDHAKALINSADDAASSMANLLLGRLRKVHGYILRDLKKELKAFDAQKGRWK